MAAIVAAIADDAKRRFLLQLPLQALRMLLMDGRKRVASENSVFWLACEWLHESGGGTAADQAALAGCIRIHQATPMYLTSVMGQSVWLRQYRADLQLAMV